MLGAESYTALKQNHKLLVDNSLCADKQNRDEKWSESLAVGSKEFVEEVKTLLHVRAQGRNAHHTGETYQLREPSFFYNAHLEVKNDDIGYENTYIWSNYIQ